MAVNVAAKPTLACCSNPGRCISVFRLRLTHSRTKCRKRAKANLVMDLSLVDQAYVRK